MFTGIIEASGKVTSTERNGGNLTLRIEASFSSELQPGESVAHNGVCLTIETIKGNEYTVTLIEETLKRSNLGTLRVGDFVNLERAMKANARFDGHFVQGHVDGVSKCFSVIEKNGSTVFTFEYEKQNAGLLVQKGSICVNGVSLTLSMVNEHQFSVSIIPFTLSHTNFGSIKPGDLVNIEFDILGKYAAKQIAALQLKSFAEN